MVLSRLFQPPPPPLPLFFSYIFCSRLLTCAPRAFTDGFRPQECLRVVFYLLTSHIQIIHVRPNASQDAWPYRTGKSPSVSKHHLQLARGCNSVAPQSVSTSFTPRRRDQLLTACRSSASASAMDRGVLCYAIQHSMHARCRDHGTSAADRHACRSTLSFFFSFLCSRSSASGTRTL